MRYKGIGERSFLVRMDKGDEVISSLILFCEKEKVSFASLSGIGAASNIVVAVFDTHEKRYIEQAFEGDLEILSLSGNVAVAQNKPMAHVHCTFANDKLEAHGGHLHSAIISVTCELIVTASESKIGRKKDEESRLMLLDI